MKPAARPAAVLPRKLLWLLMERVTLFCFAASYAVALGLVREKYI